MLLTPTYSLFGIINSLAAIPAFAYSIFHLSPDKKGAGGVSGDNVEMDGCIGGFPRGLSFLVGGLGGGEWVGLN